MADTSKPSIGVIGDFSGWGEIRGAKKEPANLRFMDIDRDSLDRVMQKMSLHVQLELPFCGTVRLSAMDHFHPDEIADRIPSISRLLEARDHVEDPRRVHRLITEAGADPGLMDASTAEDSPAEDVDAPPPVDPNSEKIPDANLLEAILEDRPPSPIPVKPSVDPIFEHFLQEIAAASIDRTDYEQQDRWRAAIDRELGLRVRSVLHHPSFQRLEALWRSLRRFFVHADFDDACRVRILDLSRKDLIDAPDEGRSMGISVLHRLVVEHEAQTSGGDPFQLLVGDFTFEANRADLALLERIGEVVLQGNVPFIGAAGESLVDLDPEEDSETARKWKEIREKPVAEYLGLAYPGILVRLPYGPDTDPIDRFAFDEELIGEHLDDLLWGNPAFAVAHALAGAEVSGIDPVQEPGLDNLPFHIFRAGDEVRQSGPARILLTDTRIVALAEKGFQPIAGIRGTDGVRICSFQSLAGVPIPSRGAR